MNSIAASLLCAALLLAPQPARCRRRVRNRRVCPRLLGVAVTAVVTGVVLVQPTVGVTAAMVVGTLWVRRSRRLRAARRRAEGAVLANALELIEGELRVGAHPARALTVAGAEAAGGVAIALRAVGARCELGGDVVGGLRAVSETSSVPDHWRRLAAYCELALHHGLAISTLIRAAHRDIVERERFSARVEAGLAGARATATILAGLPVLGITLGELAGAKPIELLLGGGLGGWLLVTGVVLACIGLFWSDRITDRLTG